VICFAVLSRHHARFTKATRGVNLRTRYLTIAIAVILGSMTMTAGAGAETVQVGAALPGAALPQEAAENFTCPETGGCGIVSLSTASGGPVTRSTVSGRVSRWRIQGASAASGYVLDILRPNADGTFAVVAASAPATVTGAAIQTFATDMPIAAGDLVAVEAPLGAQVPAVLGESTADLFKGPLTPGSTVQPFEQAASFPFTTAVNVDVEVPTLVPAPLKEVIEKTVEVKAPQGPRCVVPKLLGKTLAAAKRALKSARCKVGFVIPAPGKVAAKAKVKRTVPSPGSSLPAGTAVSVKLG
jgi:hypothetical protein